jgi:hypothetical protein
MTGTKVFRGKWSHTDAGAQYMYEKEQDTEGALRADQPLRRQGWQQRGGRMGASSDYYGCGYVVVGRIETAEGPANVIEGSHDAMARRNAGP